MINHSSKSAIAVAKSITAGLALTTLAGCYVVPLNHPIHNQSHAVVVAPELPVQLQARLYPTNDLASSTGVISGQVTNMLNGKGKFTIGYGGELLNGEATRIGSTRNGIANAAGSRGVYVNCNYTLTNSSQGNGTCEFSTGARYNLHLGG
jgi:hypothetical protein